MIKRLLTTASWLRHSLAPGPPYKEAFAQALSVGEVATFKEGDLAVEAIVAEVHPGRTILVDDTDWEGWPISYEVNLPTTYVLRVGSAIVRDRHGRKRTFTRQQLTLAEP